MKTTQTNHPSAEQLSAFAVGKLESRDVDAIENHLAECPECLGAVGQVQGDTFVGLVQDTHSVVGPQKDAPPQVDSQKDTLLHSGGESGQAIGQPLPLDLPVDSVLKEHPRYEVRELLGVGGMGSVYLAEHRMMKRTVALKLIRPQLVADQAAVDRFHREVQAAARLHHPNIVTAHDADQVGDEHFLVMEYVKGTDLHGVVEENGPLPVDRACDYVRQSALGLQHAHEKGMVHRDIKPHNLMLTPSGQVKILDFGLASLTAEKIDEEASEQVQNDSQVTALTQVGTIMGTPDYMAPEQARDARSADIRADIYSLGCTLYKLLTGKVPFPEGKVLDKILAHAQADPHPPGELRGDLPPGLADVLGRMMAKDPAARYQTPAEVADALEPFVTPRKRAEARGLLRRWPMLTGAAAVLLFALCATIIYLRTPHGTVRIEINDPGIKVKFAGETFTVNNAGESVRIRPGEHTLWIERGDLKFETKKFTLGKGENPPVRVEFLQGQVIVTQAGTELAKGPVLQTGGTRKPAQDEIILFQKLEGHVRAGGGESIALSRDGTVLASCGMRGTRIWSLPEGKLITHLRSQESGGTNVALAPDGKLAATTEFMTSKIFLWELPAGKLVGSLPTDLSNVNRLVFSPDGKWLAAAGYDAVIVWDVARNKIVNEYQGKGYFGSICFTPDGKSLVVGSSLTIWDVATGKTTRPVSGNPWLSAVGVSSGGKVLAGADADLHHITLWKLPEGKQLASLVGHEAKVLSVRFLPGDRYLMSGSEDGSIRLWDAHTGKEIARREGLKHLANFVLPLSDGRSAVSFGAWHLGETPDPQTNDWGVHVWRLPENVWPMKTTNNVVITCTNADGKSDIRLDGRPVTRGELFQQLEALVANNPNLKVHLKGDIDPTAGPEVSDFPQLLNTIAAAGVDVKDGLKFDEGIKEKMELHAEKQLEQARQRIRRTNDLREIGKALQSYHDLHGQYPPSDGVDEKGRPLLSWRVHLLPFLGEKELALYQRFRLDEAWDSEHNKKLLAENPDWFRTTEDPKKTTYLAVVGKGTAYEGGRGLKQKDITDGLGRTVYLVDAGADRAVPWTKPEDLTFDPEAPARMLGSLEEDHFLVLFCDGSVVAVSRNQKPGALRALFTRDGKDDDTAVPEKTGAGAKPRPGDKLEPKYRDAVNKGLAYLAGAQHPDGHWEALRGTVPPGQGVTPNNGGQYPVAMTALAGMAMLMEGSTTRDGPHAESVRKAVDWLMAQSQPDGRLARPTNRAESSRYMFGHGYAMMFLATVYGQEEDAERRQKLKNVLTKAVQFTAAARTKRGGWGYVAASEGHDFDECATTITQFQGLRAARNAGILVPRGLIDAEYLRKFTGPTGGVLYSLNSPNSERPALTTAALAGCEYDSELFKKWLEFCRQKIPLGGRRIGHDDYMHYYYAQALYVLGEDGYAKLFPQSRPADRLTWSGYRKAMFDELVSRQSADGSWAGEGWTGKALGPVYVTACALTILQLENGVVPIFQRSPGSE